MPIYEYQCDKCGEVFEVFQRLSDPPPKSHACGSRKVHRVMSRSSFILKGTGWYITDYGRKDKAGENSEQSKKPKKSEEKSSTSAPNKKKASGEANKVV